MKNLFFFIFALLTACSPLGAQVEYGLNAGINLANVYSNGTSLSHFDGGVFGLGSKTVIKPQFGVWINVPINSQFSVRPALLFTQKAWLLKNIEDVPTLNFNYFSIPLMLNYHYNNWRFAVGPEISYLFDQYYSETTLNFDEENPFIEEKEVELALNSGIRYEFDRWQLGIRYHLDITSFASFEIVDLNGEPVDSDPQKYYHQGIQLILGYRLNKL